MSPVAVIVGQGKLHKGVVFNRLLLVIGENALKMAQDFDNNLILDKAFR